MCPRAPKSQEFLLERLGDGKDKIAAILIMQSAEIDGDLSFSEVLLELVNSRRAIGRSGKIFENIGSLSSLNNLIMLRRLMMDLKPKRTLEVGLSFGGSCLVFTASHRDLGCDAARQHVALDPFQSTV